MNLSALPQLLTAWLKTQGAELLEAGKNAPAANKEAFQPGASYQGKVLENLANGRNLVQVGGQNVSMALPRGTQAGDTVRLTFLHNTPRPTFIMERPAVSAVQPVRLSQSAQQLTALAQLARPSATASAAPPPTSPSAAQLAQAGVAAQRPILGNTAPLANPPSLSGGGTLPMNALTGAFASATALTGGTPVAGTRAGLAAGSTTSNLAALQPGVSDSQAALPQRLHQTLRESGLFYEAHLARWSRGTFELADLRNEPQSRFVAGGHAMATAAGLTGMPEEAARLAGRQLLMLEGAPFFWQGFAWPGQWLEWQVREQSGGAGDGEDDVNTWATELRLTLPRMGGITARLSLAGERLTVGLSATETSTQEALRAALPALEQALTAAGLKPAGLGVGQADALAA
ncbi:MAG: flagellar hook-length control protein FliK [Pseudomonadota bacterium]|nr:flagellar hook-length control protein FliK [Pseudomonadota bacterium]MDP1905982.1 flagellar hook-length control protein FliK [Pseudomonadota bacterium]MDP2352432.1 flagellar hook-length control protein FliK [Pseudomonadota bacterium]